MQDVDDREDVGDWEDDGEWEDLSESAVEGFSEGFIKGVAKSKARAKVRKSVGAAKTEQAPGPITCPHCSKPLEGDAMVCEWCGKSPPVLTDETPKRRQSHRTLVAAIIGGTAVLLVVVALGIWVSSGS